MIRAAVARRYAGALLDVAREAGRLDLVAEEVAALAGALRDEPGLLRLLRHPRLSPEQRKELLLGIAGEGVSPLVRNFLRLVVDKQRELQLQEIFREFLSLVDEARNVCEVSVTAAVPLDEAVQSDLREQLSRVTGKSVRLRLEVDPSLLGGIVVRIGDRRIDGSLRTRLARMRESLAGSFGS